VALRFANSYPFSFVPARLLCLRQASHTTNEVQEEVRKGTRLSGTDIPDFGGLVYFIQILMTELITGDLHIVPKSTWMVLGKSIVFSRAVLFRTIDTKSEYSE
jgi:hypothetical protein